MNYIGQGVFNLVVYAEYLFLENFITGLIILYFSGRICGRKTKKIRLYAGGALCGLFSFTLFVNIRPAPVSLFVKLVFSVLAVSTAFSPLPFRAKRKKSGNEDCRLSAHNISCWRGQLRLLLAFYIVSFAMGGLTLAIVYLSGIKGVLGNGYVYMEAPSYISVTGGITASAVLMKIFVKCIGNVIRRQKLKCRARLELQGKKFELSAYTDTGNSLRDPLSGAPVSVISRSKAEEIIGEMTKEEAARRCCVIPFSAAGTRCGLMRGFRADSLAVKAGDVEKCFSPAVIAVYEGEFASRDAEESFDILLNKEIFGGELI